MKLIALATMMMCVFSVFNKEFHMHLHFENLPQERKLAISKMIKKDLAEHKGVRATFCKAKCIFKRGQEKENCKRQCEIEHDGMRNARSSSSSSDAKVRTRVGS